VSGCSRRASPKRDALDVARNVALDGISVLLELFESLKVVVNDRLGGGDVVSDVCFELVRSCGISIDSSS
jgi:hypothetical protein